MNQPTILGNVLPSAALAPPPPPPKLSAAVVSVYAISGAGQPTQISQNPFLVKAAMIQNISTNPVTLGTIQALVAGAGIILNAASSAGNAGGAAIISAQGSDDFTDLGLYWFSQSGTGNTLAIWVFQ